MSTSIRTRLALTAPTTARWWTVVLAGFAYGLITTLSLPPVNFWPLSFAAIVPLLWAGFRVRRPVLGALLVGLGTLPMWFGQQAWLIDVSAPGYPFLCLYLAAFPAAFVWILAQARRVDWPIPTSIIAPIAWTMLEVIRGELIWDGYGWFMLGHPLIESPFLAAPASIAGAYLVSFLCAGIAGAVADAAGWAGIRRSIGGIGALACSLLWIVLSIIGRPSQESPAARDLRVGVVQTNIPQDNKNAWPIDERVKAFARFKDLTKLAAAMQPAPEVIVWPETMFPGRALNAEAVRVERSLGLHYLLPKTKEKPEGVRIDSDYFAIELAQLQKDIGIPIVIGGVAIDGDYAEYLRRVLAPETPKSGKAGATRPEDLIKRYNSSFVISAGVVGQRYDKAELTPFGEVIPYVWRWPGVQQMVLDLGAKGMEFDLAMGKRIGGVTIPLNAASSGGGTPLIRVATPICFEGTKSDLCRRLVVGLDAGGRSAAIFNMSNDGWFGWWDGGREQHLLASRWRCVELRVPMVRSVNTGVSALIDARGKVITERLIDRPEGVRRADGVLSGTIRIDPARPKTFFELLGMIPAYTVLFVGMLATLVLWIRRRRVGLGLV